MDGDSVEPRHTRFMMEIAFEAGQSSFLKEGVSKDQRGSDWVQCPICDEPDMNKVDGLIRCTNLCCGSNGGTNFVVPKGWKLIPDYPEGHVIGPCICGSWPGGPCLKCPPFKEKAGNE